MKRDVRNSSLEPIVIGGVGGSGTRVVAEILSRLGFYMGNDLNHANDNLLYTLLFKRAKWYYKNYKNNNIINTGIKLFHKLMLNIGFLTMGEYLFLLQAFCSVALYGHNKNGDGKGIWSLKRIYKLLTAQKYNKHKYRGWGWKEPNSLLLIENLNDHFSEFKYIHIIRHGLDMAFSTNQQQLYNWGQLFGIEIPVTSSDEPKASLKYWIKVNEKVFEIGEKLGKDRFLIINFDELCISPENEIKKLISFLDLDVDEKLYDRILRLPKKPDSIGRYKIQRLEQFDKSDLNKLSQFGFSIE